MRVTVALATASPWVACAESAFVLDEPQKSETPGPMKGRGFELGVHVFVFVVIFAAWACVAIEPLAD